MLILPGHSLFYETLAHPPKGKISYGTNYVCRSGSFVLEPVNESDLEEYLEGGEYTERMNEWEKLSPSLPPSDILFLPNSIQF